MKMYETSHIMNHLTNVIPYVALHHVNSLLFDNDQILVGFREDNLQSVIYSPNYVTAATAIRPRLPNTLLSLFLVGCYSTPRNFHALPIPHQVRLLYIYIFVTGQQCKNI